MSDTPSRIWVHPLYKKKLKKDAALAGTSILELTKMKALSEYDIEEKPKKKKKEFGIF